MKNINITAYRAKDLMSVRVLSAYENWSIQELAIFFLDHNITGAPVISSDHRLIGVVSISDIFRFENADDSVKSEALRSCYRDATGIDIINRKDLIEWTKNAEKNCKVQQIMAPQIINVDVNDSLADVAEIMVEYDIHRVFVTEHKKIIGVISTIDILRVLVQPEYREAQVKR